MRKNTAKRITARPRLFAVFSTFWGINGRRTVIFNISRDAGYKAIARRVFTFSSILFGLCVWVFPAQALAEWDNSNSATLSKISSDTSSLRENSYSIEGHTEAIYDNVYRLKQLSETDTINVQRILQALGYVDSYGTFSSTLYNDMLAVKSGLNVLNENDLDKLDYLQRIEDFLSNIEALLESNGGGSGSGGEGSTEINQDWVKETTFQEYSDNFQTYYDWMRSSFGFTGGSGDTLKSVLSYFVPKSSELMYIYTGSLFQDNTPFPVVTSGAWKDYQSGMTYENVTPFYKEMNKIFYEYFTRMLDLERSWAIKQSWNDWYAHTNLVSTLERLLDNTPPENRVDSTSDIGTITQSQNGGEVLNITYNSGTGDSPETIDLTPAFTNNVAQLSTDADDIKKDFDDIWDYDKIKERYVDSEKFNSTSSFQDVQQKEVSNYTIQYGNKPYMQFRWSGTALRMYKAIFSYDRMRLLRSTFGRMWDLLVIWGCYVLFRILGKANA